MTTLHEDETVLLTSLTVEAAAVVGHVFRRCVIQGPAMVALHPSTRMVDCTYEIEVKAAGEGGIEALLVEIPARVIVGAVGLIDCDLEACTFRGVGFIGTAAMLDRIRVSLMDL